MPPFNSSKAQGLSLRVIIIAVIALIVLVVLVVSFTGKWKLFGKAQASCESKASGAHCAISCKPSEVPDPYTDCKQRYPEASGSNGPLCCIPFLAEKEEAKPAKGDKK